MVVHRYIPTNGANMFAEGLKIWWHGDAPAYEMADWSFSLCGLTCKENNYDPRNAPLMVKLHLGIRIKKQQRKTEMA